MGRENQPTMDVLVPEASAEKLNRRRFLGTGVVTAAGLYLAACGSSSGGAGKAATKTVATSAKVEGALLIANWADYIDPTNLAAFTRQTGAKIRTDSYDSNDALLAKLNAGGAKYDIVVPNASTTQIMIKRGLAMKLNLDLIPNHKNILPAFMQSPFDPGRQYSAPKDIGIAGFFYRTAVIKERPSTLMEMFDLLSKYPNARVNFVDDPNQVVETALVALGLDINTTKQADLDKARELLTRIKPYVDTFNSDYMARAGAGQIDIGLGYNGDSIRIIKEREAKGDEVLFLLSEASTDYWIDNWVIPAEAKNPIAAHKWINFVLDPQVAGKEMQYVKYQVPVSGANQYAGAIAKDPLLSVPDAQLSKYQTLTLTDPKQLAARARLYSDVKAA